MRSFVPDFDLVRASKLEDALHAIGEGWRPIAGGTDLMVLFNAGKLPYRKLISVGRVPELLQVDVSDTEVCLGAAVTYTRIRQDPVLQREFAVLCATASWTGSLANQNRGTLGGNIVNASPAADSAPALLAYDAEVELVSLSGTRRIPYRHFHLGYKQMEMRDDELVRAIYLPRSSRESRSYCRKVGPRKAQAISKVCFVATARVTGSMVEDIRIAAGSVAPVPLRCYEAEAVIRGQRLTPDLITHASSTIAEEVQPITDIRSTREYRRAVTSNLLADFLQSLQ
jgi:CO/xanthine dehydrogenase FAD-binding subunit